MRRLHNKQREKFKNLNSQGMDIGDWLCIHFEKGLDVA